MSEPKTKRGSVVFLFKLVFIAYFSGFAHIVDAEFNVGQTVELILDWEQFSFFPHLFFYFLKSL